MELKDFILKCKDYALDDIVVYYKDGKYSLESDPSIYDVLDEMALDAEAFDDLEIFIEIPSKNFFYRKTISMTEVSPLSLPEADSTTLPSVRIAFNPFTFAPEQLVLEKEFMLPVKNWLSVKSTIPDHWPSIDVSYGIPFGIYKLKIRLPDLPELSKRSAEIIVSLDPEINLSATLIQSGQITRDYSKFSYSIKWIDPIAFRLFELIKKQVGNRQTRKIQETLMAELANTKSLEDVVLPKLPQDIPDDDAFQISRNMSSYRFLYFVENQIRQFLWNKLQNIYEEQVKNPKWWMGCFPKEIRNHIKEKMSTKNPILDSIKIESTPLHYCSFNELGQLIEKEWQKIFKDRPLDRYPFFGHLSYLENIRNAIAHNRPLSNAEVSILFENGRSILTMLKINIPRTLYNSLFGEISI